MLFHTFILSHIADVDARVLKNMHVYERNGFRINFLDDLCKHITSYLDGHRPFHANRVATNEER